MNAKQMDELVAIERQALAATTVSGLALTVGRLASHLRTQGDEGEQALRARLQLQLDRAAVHERDQQTLVRRVDSVAAEATTLRQTLDEIALLVGRREDETTRHAVRRLVEERDHQAAQLAELARASQPPRLCSSCQCAAAYLTCLDCSRKLASVAIVPPEAP